MSAENITVYFDGACPLCVREIAFYRTRTSPAAVRYLDVNEADPDEFGEGLDAERALKRFHVRDETGLLEVGSRAFGRLWLETPGFAWAGRLVRLPVVWWLADRLYDAFLTVRPQIQAFVRTRMGDAEPACPDGQCQNGKRIS